MVDNNDSSIYQNGLEKRGSSLQNSPESEEGRLMYVFKSNDGNVIAILLLTFLPADR